jgi:hypothetical protein
MSIEDLEKRLAIAKQSLDNALRGIGSEDWEIASDRFDFLEREIALAKGEECAIPFRPPSYYDDGSLVPADVKWGPEAAVSGPFLLQTDRSCFLNFNGVDSKTSSLFGDETNFFGFQVTIEFEVCQITKFGYPNDEAIEGHPLYSKGLRAYDIFEVENSSWIKSIERQNQVSFPNSNYKSQRHFIFTFHDSTFECIARDLKATLSEKPIKEIIEPLIGRIMAE